MLSCVLALGSSGLVVPSPPATFTAVHRAPLAQEARSAIFPTDFLIADAASSAKAKIEAAKAAQEAKLAARGGVVPETKAIDLDGLFEGKKDDVAAAESSAAALRERRLAGEEARGALGEDAAGRGKKISKAQAAQLKIMENQARAKARLKEKEALEREMEKANGGGGFALPSLPSLPSPF